MYTLKMSMQQLTDDRIKFLTYFKKGLDVAFAAREKIVAEIFNKWAKKEEHKDANKND